MQRFECGNAFTIRNGIMFDFYPGLPHVAYMYAATLYANIASLIIEPYLFMQSVMGR